jgi:hypothetical protein
MWLPNWKGEELRCPITKRSNLFKSLEFTVENNPVET